MINLIFVNHLLLGDGINLSFFQNRFNNLINTINGENVRFCKAHWWKHKRLFMFCVLSRTLVSHLADKNKHLENSWYFHDTPLCPLAPQNGCG